MNIIDDIPKARVEARARITLNAIVFVFDAIGVAYNRLTILLISSRGRDLGDQIIACCWDIIDWTERLRKLLGYGAGIKKKEDWFKALMKAVAPAEEIRHTLQHLDGHMEYCLKESLPTVGHLVAYVINEKGNGFDIMISLPSGFKNDGTDKLAAYVKVKISFEPPVTAATFFVGDKRINLTVMFHAIEEGRKQLCEFIRRAYIEPQPGNGEVRG